MTEATIGRVAAFWDRRPCNVRHSTADLERDPAKYSQDVTMRKLKVEPHIVEFSDFTGWEGKRVLDLGCGIGTQSLLFALCGADVTAVDLSAKSLDIAGRRAQAEFCGKRITFLQADIERLSDSLPVEPFDLVYSFGVIHHTPRPERAIAEARKYMGPDSIFKLMLYHRYSWKVLSILWALRVSRFGSVDEKVAQYSEAQTGCPVTRTYTRKSVAALLGGFVIDDLRVDHIFPYRIPEYVQYRYVKELPWRLMPDWLFRWLERQVGWHMLITARPEGI